MPDTIDPRLDAIRSLILSDKEPDESTVELIRQIAGLSADEVVELLGEGEPADDGTADDEPTDDDDTDDDTESLALPSNQSASPIVDTLIRQGTAAAQIVADEIRAKVRSLVKKNDLTTPFERQRLLSEVRMVLAEHEPAMARVLSDSLLAAWIHGADEVSGVLDDDRDPVEPLPRIPPPDRPRIRIPGMGDEDGDVRFPGLEQAVQSLVDRQVLMPLDLARLESGARQTAFGLAGVQTAEAMEAIRDALVEDIAEGGTLRDFRSRVLEVLDDRDEAPLSPARIETIYRTEVGMTHTRAMANALAHPLVGDEFPYVAYHAVHDSRVRPEHLKMESLGLDRTNVFRKDDPIWERFTPPWDFSCRCALVPLTLDDAARAGVREAQEWLRTGIPPQNPKYIKAPPFDAPEGFEGVRLSFCGAGAGRGA